MKKAILFIFVLLQLSTISYAKILPPIEEKILIPEDVEKDLIIESRKFDIFNKIANDQQKIIISKKTTSGNRLTEDEIGVVATASVKIRDFSVSDEIRQGRNRYVIIKMTIETDPESAFTSYVNKSESEKAELVNENRDLKKENAELKRKLNEHNNHSGLYAEIREFLSKQERFSREFEEMAIKATEEYSKYQNKEKEKGRKRIEELRAVGNNINKIIAQAEKNVSEMIADIKGLENESIRFVMPVKKEIQYAVSNAIDKLNGIQLEKQKFKTQMLQHEQEIITSCDLMLQKTEGLMSKTKKKEFETWEEYSNRKRSIEMPLLKEREKVLALKKKWLLENRSTRYAAYGRKINHYVEYLIRLQSELYSNSGKEKYATLSEKIVIEDKNLIEKYFILEVFYNKKKYNLVYDFSGIGREKAEALISSIRKGKDSNVKAMPLFSIEEENGKIREKLVAFDIIYPVTGIGTKRIYLHRMLKDISENKEFFTFM